MIRNDLKQIIAFLSLALTVYLLRNVPSGMSAFIIASGAIVLFWYLHSVKIALSNFRTVVLMILALGFLLLAFREYLPQFSAENETGSWTGGDMNPSQIQKLKTSHSVALEIHLDHPPTPEDRYFKEGVLVGSLDGLNYQTRPQAVDERLMPLANSWIKENNDSHPLDDQVAQIRKWWMKDFTYTMEPGADTGTHPLDHFLFETKRGFCEHYAAALSTLLRLKGIETRVVVGFYGGAWNPLLHKLSFEQADAHAWIEARDTANHQWRRLDPTLWVAPELNQHGTDTSTGWGLLDIVFGLGLIVYFLRPKSRDPVLLFIKKLEKLEKQRRTHALGLTISERVEELSKTARSTELAMKESLSLYLKSYYDKNSNPRGARELLLASLKKW